VKYLGRMTTQKTLKGREQFVEKTSEWERLTRAMGLTLGDSAGPSGEEA
jgi:hypothetical protein